MGTVWNLNMYLRPIGVLEYHTFRIRIMEELARTFACDSVIYKSIDSILPHTYSDVIDNPIHIVDFDGGYGVGEKVFDIFIAACELYMFDGTKIEVSSWEDAGGNYKYIKGSS